MYNRHLHNSEINWSDIWGSEEYGSGVHYAEGEHEKTTSFHDSSTINEDFVATNLNTATELN